MFMTIFYTFDQSKIFFLNLIFITPNKIKEASFELFILKYNLHVAKQTSSYSLSSKDTLFPNMAIVMKQMIKMEVIQKKYKKKIHAGYI